MNESIRKPNGVNLVTGPTGSGKSTTLYAVLGEINTTDVSTVKPATPRPLS